MSRQRALTTVLLYLQIAVRDTSSDTRRMLSKIFFFKRGCTLITTGEGSDSCASLGIWTLGYTSWLKSGGFFLVSYSSWAGTSAWEIYPSLDINLFIIVLNSASSVMFPAAKWRVCNRRIQRMEVRVDLVSTRRASIYKSVGPLGFSWLEDSMGMHLKRGQTGGLQTFWSSQ